MTWSGAVLKGLAYMGYNLITGAIH